MVVHFFNLQLSLVRQWKGISCLILLAGGGPHSSLGSHLKTTKFSALCKAEYDAHSAWAVRTASSENCSFLTSCSDVLEGACSIPRLNRLPSVQKQKYTPSLSSRSFVACLKHAKTAPNRGGWTLWETLDDSPAFPGYS